MKSVKESKYKPKETPDGVCEDFQTCLTRCRNIYLQAYSKWLSGFWQLLIHNTLQIGVYVFFYLIEQHSKFVTYLTGALYVHPLWFYKYEHDNPVRSKLFVACQRWWFLLHTHPFSWNCAYHLRTELSDGGSLQNLVRNCRWTIVTDRRSWNVSTQNAFSLRFAAILVNRAPSGEMRNYCTPHIMKENF